MQLYQITYSSGADGDWVSYRTGETLEQLMSESVILSALHRMARGLGDADPQVWLNRVRQALVLANSLQDAVQTFNQAQSVMYNDGEYLIIDVRLLASSVLCQKGKIEVQSDGWIINAIG